MAAKKGVNINVDIPIRTNAFIDRNMITTVLRNLISNAVKFTSSGDQIVLETSLNESLIEISIKDSGVGIPQKNIDNIFKIDSNLSTHGTADEQGTGLGLIISREFVEKNGGTICVESEEGKGTKFTFTVPIYND